MFAHPVLHSSKENWLTPASPLFCSLFHHPAEPPPCPYFSLVLTFFLFQNLRRFQGHLFMFQITLDVSEIC